MDHHEVLEKYGPEFEKSANESDAIGLFARDNFETLRSKGIYKMAIPKELGGGGVAYSALCHFLKELGKCCPSTALTLSMHQHLVCGLVFKHQNGDTSATQTLKNIAEKNIILLSTGGGDWLCSNGHAEKVEGGYKVNCKKSFCSGAPIADVVIMSCAYKQKNQHSVIHFSLPMDSAGISIIDDWDAMGMRRTGSCSVLFKDVFVADEKISLIRESGTWHPALNVVSVFTFPLVVSTYAGITEKMAEMAVTLLSTRQSAPSFVLASLGEVNNQLRITQWAFNQLVDNAKELNAKPNDQLASEAHQAKSIFAQHSIKCAQAVMEAVGGFSYYKRAGIERLYRDLVAGDFHPMQAAKQKEVLGGYLLGKSLAG